MDFAGKFYMVARDELKDSRISMCFLAVVFTVMLVGFVNVKHVKIIADGKTHEVATASVRVDRILHEAGIHLDEKDEFTLSTKNIVDGAVIEVHRAKLVTVEHGDRAKVYRTAKQTVGEFMESVGLDKKGYIASMDKDVKLWNHMSMSIMTKKEHDDMLRLAEERAAAEAEAKKDHAGEFDGIAYRDVLTMEASAYLPTDGGGDCVTATGMPAGHGVVAVDPDVIPLGTKLYIPGYGHAIAADTGGMIEGHMIDLCMESYDDAVQFGRRDIEVYVLEY